MEYDRGDSFPFAFEPDGIQSGSKPKGKLSPRSYSIQCERKWKHSFLSVHRSPGTQNGGPFEATLWCHHADMFQHV